MAKVLIVVFALDKFTIPGAKRLVIEMFERNDGRNLTLSINSKAIVNARLIDSNEYTLNKRNI
ncbi:MAG TPA: DUF4138 domain-containing protein [Cyclobacteriaceae bacterium]|nr:DUF4138 domain-containing protein [Cyclobacteriaceae bacterium]